jgi:hypothetical protein
MRIDMPCNLLELFATADAQYHLYDSAEEMYNIESLRWFINY